MIELCRPALICKSADALDAYKKQILGFRNGIAQPRLKKAFAYSRSVYEISSEAQQEFGKVVEQ